MTLYLRTNQSAKALSLCESCAPAQFSQNELENLGKAARNEKQYDRAVAFYSQLQKQYPDNPNGWLGGALAFTETKNYNAAKNALSVYKNVLDKIMPILMLRVICLISLNPIWLNLAVGNVS